VSCPGAALPPPGIEVTKGGATKGRETQKKMRLVKTSRIFFCKERLKPIFLPETKNSRPQGGTKPAPNEVSPVWKRETAE